MTEGGGEDNCQLTSSTTHTPQPLDSPTTPLYSILFYIFSTFWDLDWYYGLFFGVMVLMLGPKICIVVHNLWKNLAQRKSLLHPASFKAHIYKSHVLVYFVFVHVYLCIRVFSRRVLQCSNLHLQLAKPNLQSEWKIIVVPAWIAPQIFIQVARAYNFPSSSKLFVPNSNGWSWSCDLESCRKEGQRQIHFKCANFEPNMRSGEILNID